MNLLGAKNRRCQMKKLALLLLLVGLIVPYLTVAEEEAESLSPYFFVQSDDPSLDPFPLLETKARVNIAGVIADIELTQVYKNDGNRTIEAIYVFPLGTKAAIHRMKMRVGERTIEANIEEKIAAQKIYQEAKEAGQVTSLLEQKRPNVFEMKVANIMPGDKVEVVVNYTELLVPQEGIYEFVYPTVVGPRYGGEVSDQANNQWISSPYQHQGQAPTYNFDIDINLKTGIPLSKVVVPSHSVGVTKDKDSARIRLSEDETKGGNRDFILRYGLKGKAIQTGLLLYPGESDNFFLLMAQPPQRVTPKDIPAREYTFVVDVSGSMNGFPLDVSKTLIKKLINSLRGEDYFNILFFAGGSETLSPYPLAATKENKQRAIAMLQAQRGSGGTNILSAMEKVIALEKKEGLSRTIIAATDGYIGVEKEVFDLIRENLSEANFFAFGIGTGVNRYLIEGMARAGCGEPFVVTNQKEAGKTADRFLQYVNSPLLTDIKLSFEGFDAYDVEPISIPDLFAQRPLVIYGKYHEAKGKIRIQGKTAYDDYLNVIKVSAGLEDKTNEALKYLWAREKIARLDDYGAVGLDVKDELTQLGLKYSLMTAYTSFVAVDTVIRDTGEVVTVKQPLPLPQGVSDYAVGRGYAKACKSGLSTTYSANLQGGYGPAVAYESGIADQYYVSQPIPPKIEITRVYLSGAKYPQGITLSEIKKLLSPLEQELVKLFREWELKKIQIALSVKAGQVKSIKIKSHEGKDYEKKALENALKKISFPASLTGEVELYLYGV